MKFMKAIRRKHQERQIDAERDMILQDLIVLQNAKQQLIDEGSDTDDIQLIEDALKNNLSRYC